MPSVVWAMGKTRAWQVNAAGLAAVKASKVVGPVAEVADPVVEVVADNKQDKSPKCDMLS